MKVKQMNKQHNNYNLIGTINSLHEYTNNISSSAQICRVEPPESNAAQRFMKINANGR